LKPDVCRRVVRQTATVPARKGQMAPISSTKILAYFVRSLELVLETSSHDWHVQPSCQRTEFAFRLSGALFSPEQRAHTNAAFCLSSKPVQVIGLPEELSTHCAHRIFTGYAQGPGAGRLPNLDWVVGRWSLVVRFFEKMRTAWSKLGVYPFTERRTTDD
jgi:hypothetical protein